jgi:hypothetical protein
VGVDAKNPEKKRQSTRFTRCLKEGARYLGENLTGKDKTVAYDRVFVGLQRSSGAKGVPTTIPYRTVAAEAGPEGAADVRIRCVCCASHRSCVCGTRMGSSRIEAGARW